MKVLQLCLRVPDPPGDGGSIAMKSIAESLMASGAELKVLAFNTKKHFIDEYKINNSFKEKTALELVYLDATVKVLPAFFNLFSKSSYHINRFVSQAFKEKLIEILSDPSIEIVQLESLYFAPYVQTIREHSNSKIVLRAHNVEYLIWERLLAAPGNFFKKAYLSILTRRLKAYETSMLNRYDAILPITEEDKKIMERDGCRVPFHVTPLGLDSGKYRMEIFFDGVFSVFHLGSMDWQPNLEGVDWFIAKILPGLRTKEPTIKVYLAGKKMPARIKNLADETLLVEDFISNAIHYMSDKSVMVVPLLSGGGMRVKIIEGMAMGKTIISSRIGAEGIACEHLKNIILADTPDEFVKWIIYCKKHPEECKRIGAQARLLVSEQYDNKIIGKRLFEFYSRELKPGIKI